MSGPTTRSPNLLPRVVAVESNRLDPVTWTSGPATAGKTNNVDATAGAKTVPLPTGVPAGIPIAVQKTDASANGISITGKIRGATGTLLIKGNRYETQVLVSEGSDSWWPYADHKTWASIDAEIAAIAGTGGGATVVAPATLGATATLDLASRAATSASYLLSSASSPSVLTLSNRVAGARVLLRVQQDNLGGRSFHLTDGTTTLAIPIDPGPSTVTFIRVEVFSTTEFYPIVAGSAQGDQQPEVPSNTAAPVVTGSATPGSTLTCTSGMWRGFPTPTYSRVWKLDGVAIPGATASTYVPVASDATHVITCTVTATNASGSVSVASSNSITPALSVPVNTVAPAITGIANTGLTLTCAPGTWTGSPAPTFAYQWKRDGASIAGATSATYVQAVADQTHAITCVVTGTNASAPGGVTATSNSVTSTAFDPAAYATILAWLKADALGLSDGDPVTTWTDSSAAGHSPTQATAGSKPTYRINVQNGLPVVRFADDGTLDDRLGVTFTQAQPVTYFVVGRYRNAYAANDTLFGASALVFLQRRSSTQMGLYAGTGPLLSTTTPQSWHVHEAVVNGASSESRYDGGTATTGNIGANAPGGLVLGSYSIAGNDHGAVDIGEVVMCSGVLSATNRQAIEANLKLKWGTP